MCELYLHSKNHSERFAGTATFWPEQGRSHTERPLQKGLLSQRLGTCQPAAQQCPGCIGRDSHTHPQGRVTRVHNNLMSHTYPQARHTHIHKKLTSHMHPHEARVRRVWWLHSPNLERAPLSRDRTHRHRAPHATEPREERHETQRASRASRQGNQPNPRAHSGGPNLYDIAEQTIETYGAPGWGNGWHEGCLHPWTGHVTS